MEKRIIAVQYDNSNAKENVEALLKAFVLFAIDCSLVVFKKTSLDGFSLDGVQEIDFPEDKDTNAKCKNYILDYAKLHGFKGFMHVIENNVKLLKDPSLYISKVEKTMDSLDYSIYFSTVTDPCNYLFKKFNPRLTLDIDDVSIKEKLSLPDKISFTSHSNLCWTIYDFNKLDEVLKFDEKFSIAMYEIIEYLARRRATKKDGQLYYMNLYLSIVDEVGVYEALDILGPSIDPKTMQEEDALFKAMKVDFVPDNNIDIVLEAFYLKVKEKMG